MVQSYLIQLQKAQYRTICTNNGWNVVNTPAGELSNKKVSHLMRFILGFWTENTVSLSEVSHVVSVPRSEIFVTVKWEKKILNQPKVSHLVRCHT